MYFNLTNNKILENCKIKKLSKKLIAATFTINKIKQTKLYNIEGNCAKLILVREYNLTAELNRIKELE